MVRTGGWGWGRSPDDLVEAALEALPELVEAACAGLGQHGDHDLPGPVSVTARVSMSELERRGAGALRAAFADGLTAATPTARLTDDEVEPARPNGAAPDDEHPVRGPLAASAPLPSPRDLLLRWLRDGVLDGLLELLHPETLEAWHSAALGTAPAAPGAAARVDPAARQMVEGLLGALPEATTRADLLRARLALAAAAAAPRSDWPAAVALANAARPASGLAELPETAARGRPGSSATTRRGEADGRASVRARTAASGSDRGTGDTGAASGSGPSPAPVSSVALVLPFLAAVPLARIGYFEALAAALGAARLSGQAEIFAAAFAHKLLAPPERGWRRTSETTRAAAAFAGSDVPAEAFTELARDAPRFTSALDATLAMAVMTGRGREGLLLHRDQRGDLVLLDPVGSFPIALTPDPEAIARVLREGGRPAVHLTASARSAGVVGALRDARIPVDARRRSGRSSTDLERVDSMLAAIAARTAAPLAEEQALERSLSLAAGLGLSMLAWTLWSNGGRTDALLALTRLGDLEGRVRIEPDRVRVTLPMGRRQRDLRDGGILDGVSGLPWLGGRRLEFGS
jgi:hypothetical protein